MKLWHDDIRRAPDESWTWARTNDEAKRLLEEHAPWSSSHGNDPITEISLDHDLGMHDEDPDDLEAVFLKGDAADNGYALVCWMIENKCVPPKVTIHSWNPIGAANMAARFNRFGYDCYISPFKLAS